MPSEPPPAPAFSPEAEEALDAYYRKVGAKTTQEKIGALEENLGGPSNFYAFGGDVSDEMKLGCLEYEFLVVRGLVDLVLI